MAESSAIHYKRPPGQTAFCVAKIYKPSAKRQGSKKEEIEKSSEGGSERSEEEFASPEPSEEDFEPTPPPPPPPKPDVPKLDLQTRRSSGRSF
ncbi:hypothetical protein N7452_001492 [Penicillium brevicompactum]|uniref:Uncharacterized protein n=1 Tax=Penicillium brevicompactum TaxID=5074 RepID=A0A9W9R2H1_PENBR|nr:hypothetical protein N7452_001492 [Penicillium brevicompactum]